MAARKPEPEVKAKRAGSRDPDPLKNAAPVGPKDGAHPGVEVVDNWPTSTDVEREHGVSRRHFGRMCSRLGIKRYLATGETFRFDPKDVLLVLNTMKDEEPADAIELAEVNNAATRGVFEGSIDQVKAAHSHALQSWASVHEPGRILLGMLRDENARLVARVEYLEAKLDEYREAKEDMLSQLAARELAKLQVEKAEERKSKAFEVFRENVPKIVAQLQLAGAAQDPRAQAGLALLASLTPEQVHFLMNQELGLLSPEQQALVNAMVGASSGAPNGAAS